MNIENLTWEDVLNSKYTQEELFNFLRNSINSSKHSYSNIPQCFLTLELGMNCTKEDVIRNFRRLAVKYHPDKVTGSKQKFLEISTAKDECLSRI